MNAVPDAAMSFLESVYGWLHGETLSERYIHETPFLIVPTTSADCLERVKTIE